MVSPYDCVDTWGHGRHPRRNWDEAPHVIVAHDHDGHFWAYDCGHVPTLIDARGIAMLLEEDCSRVNSMGRDCVVRCSADYRTVYLDADLRATQCPHCLAGMPIGDPEILIDLYDCGYNSTGRCDVTGYNDTNEDDQ